MKNLTQQLIESSGGMLNISPEVSDRTGLYHMFDDGAATQEECEFLYGLVKIVQPTSILETGTFTGCSALFMAQALKDNGHGRLVTLEIERTHKERAERLWNQCGVSEFVTCKLQSSMDFQAEGIYDMLFLDSEPQIRLHEVVRFFPSLKPGGYILIDDLFGHLGQEGTVNPDHPEIVNWPFGVIPQAMAQWLAEDKLRVVPLPNPRGLVLLYRTKEDDFKI